MIPLETKTNGRRAAVQERPRRDPIDGPAEYVPQRLGSRGVTLEVTVTPEKVEPGRGPDAERDGNRRLELRSLRALEGATGESEREKKWSNGDHPEAWHGARSMRGEGGWRNDEATACW